MAGARLTAELEIPVPLFCTSMDPLRPEAPEVNVEMNHGAVCGPSSQNVIVAALW